MKLQQSPRSDLFPFAGDSLERSYLFYDRPSTLSSNAPRFPGTITVEWFCCANRLCVRSPCHHNSRMRTFDENSCAISMTSPRSLFRPRTQQVWWDHREKSRRASTLWDCRGKSRQTLYLLSAVSFEKVTKTTPSVESLAYTSRLLRSSSGLTLKKPGLLTPSHSRGGGGPPPPPRISAAERRKIM